MGAAEADSWMYFGIFRIIATTITAVDMTTMNTGIRLLLINATMAMTIVTIVTGISILIISTIGYGVSQKSPLGWFKP